jgi:CheY-like chemotaxis protein
MDASLLDRIFDPFFTTKSAGEGTGLGLSVVHGVMKAHEGAVTVHSEKNKGTTFHMYFPVVESAKNTMTSESQPPQSATHRGHGERILLVDDDKSLVFLITRMLERLGYHISGFTDARQALDAFLTDPNSFDLVIADWFMPGIPGMDLARQMLEKRRDIRIVIASGVNHAEARSQAIAIGVQDVIPRPTTASDWSEALHRILSTTPLP